jgi:putative nucleotidyltransferase with HDIG domain
MPEFDPPAVLRPLIGRLDALSHELGVQAYVVGGSVRDALLGRPMHDLDIAVDARAFDFARHAAAVLNGHFVEMDGVHGVARIVLERAAAVHHIDVAQLQGTLDDDMRRRDFTVNSLAVRLGGSAVVDVAGGLDDLAAVTVRMNRAQVFDADPLRLLRAVRLAAELRFAIDPATAAEVRRRAPEALAAAAERQRDELARIFALEDCYGALRLLDGVGLLDVLLPEVVAGRGVAQPEAYHAYDVFEHGLHAVEALDAIIAADEPAGEPMRTVRRTFWHHFGWAEESLRGYLSGELSEGRSRGALLRFAGLLHDVAKPQTQTFDQDGRARFFGHAGQGAAMARKITRRLRFSTREVQFVSKLVAEHMRPVQLAAVGEAPTRRALYRFYRDLGDAAAAVLLLALADAASARGPRLATGRWSRHVAYLNSLLVRSIEEEGIVDPPRLLTGNDIMSRAGVPEGPAIGRLLEALREAQAAGEVTDERQALEFVTLLAREESQRG